MKKVKPFVKWAGGKTQLIDKISQIYPKELGKSITKYAEPFVGGGAVLFDILSKFDLEEIYISDINKELINTYNIIKNNADDLIQALFLMQNEFLSDENRKVYFYEKRKLFNDLIHQNSQKINIQKATLFIFLNKTCFNGLFRVNKNGLFNVPIGSYKNQTIYDENNLKNISKMLNKVKITSKCYQKSENFIDKNTFVYLDPPYRPLSKTANFTSYNETIFDDNEQIKLANFFTNLDKKGAKLALSNSDPKNINEEDDFFDKIYKDYEINQIYASRMINSKGNSRGKITELLITNYKWEQI